MNFKTPQDREVRNPCRVVNTKRMLLSVNSSARRVRIWLVVVPTNTM